MRIAKFIRDADICSRRDAEAFIFQGRVLLNDQKILSPAINIDPYKDVVKIDNKPIIFTPTKMRLWIYYKPKNIITTHNDPAKRTTVFQLLKNRINITHIMSVGRLDYNSEGLLLLTNNAKVARYFELPANRFERKYKVRAFSPDDKIIDLKNAEIVIDGIKYSPKLIKRIQSRETKSKNHWYDIILNTGKNREIRKIFEHFGLEINKLIRVKFAHYKLDNLQPDQYTEVEIDPKHFNDIDEA